MHGNGSAATGTNVQHVEQPPVFTPCQPTSSTCVPGQQQQQQQQMCVPGQPGLQPSSAINNQTQMNYLMAAYRVGMLAMETLGRNDRPQMKYARNPPYGEDVKRLLGVALKLGECDLKLLTHLSLLHRMNSSYWLEYVDGYNSSNINISQKDISMIYNAEYPFIAIAPRSTLPGVVASNIVLIHGSNRPKLCACVEIELLICIKMNLTSNNLQRLICHKIKP